MRGLFVTGTDTGVGKSVVAAAICAGLAERGLRVAAFKPVVTGLDERAPHRSEEGWPEDHVLLATASGSALLLAVTTIVCWLVITDGAVYKPPAEMLPEAGETDQVTLVSVAPVALAVNC